MGRGGVECDCTDGTADLFSDIFGDIEKHLGLTDRESEEWTNQRDRDSIIREYFSQAQAEHKMAEWWEQMGGLKCYDDCGCFVRMLKLSYRLPQAYLVEVLRLLNDFRNRIVNRLAPWEGYKGDVKSYWEHPSFAPDYWLQTLDGEIKMVSGRLAERIRDQASSSTT